MLTLSLDVDSNTPTDAFETTKDGKVWVHIDTDTAMGTVTMQYSKARNSTYATFAPDGVDETFTVTTTKLYDLPGGWNWRFIGESGVSDGNNYYVDGNHIRLL